MPKMTVAADVAGWQLPKEVRVRSLVFLDDGFGNADYAARRILR